MYASYVSNSALTLCITLSRAYHHAVPWRVNTPFTDGALDYPSGSHSDTESIISDSSTAYRRRFVFGTPTSRAGSPDNGPSAIASEMGLAAEELGVVPLRDWKGTAVWATSTSHSNSDYRQRLDHELQRSSSLKVLRGTSSFGTDVESPDLRDIVGSRRARPRSNSRLLGSATNDGGSDLQPDDDEISMSMALGSGPMEPFVPRRSSSGSKFREEVVFPTKPENPFQWIRQLSRRTIRRTSLELPRLCNSRRAENTKVMVTFAVPKKFFKFKSSKSQQPSIASPIKPDIRPAELPLKTFGPRDKPILNRANTKALSTVMGSISESASENMQAPGLEPPSRLTLLRGAIGKGPNTHYINQDRNLIPRDHTNQINLPPRASTAPPGQVHTELEFLTTEATGILTPSSPANLNPLKIGSKMNSRSSEMDFFNRLGMIQSRPSLPGPNEPPDVEVDPSDRSIVHTTGTPHPVSIFPNVDAVAPFLEQDRELVRRSAELITRPSSSASMYRPFKATWSSRRLNEVASDTLRPGSPSPRVSTESRRSMPSQINTPTTEHANADSITNRTRNKRSLSAWLKAKHIETGEDYSDRPIDVQLERMRRDERNTGILGLTPKEELENFQYSSMSEESVSYAAAAREIAGLGKQPNRKKRRGSMLKGSKGGKGVEMLMG